MGITISGVCIQSLANYFIPKDIQKKYPKNTYSNYVIVGILIFTNLFISTPSSLDSEIILEGCLEFTYMEVPQLNGQTTWIGHQNFSLVTFIRLHICLFLCLFII